MKGTDILDQLFDIREINSWGMFGALIGWIILFRLVHYGIFVLEVRPYLQKIEVEK